MGEKLKRLAALAELKADGYLERIVALQRTAVVVTLCLLATHFVAWLLGRLGWPL